MKYTKVKLVKLNELDELDGGAKFDIARKIITKLLIDYLKKNKKFNNIKLLQLKEENKTKLQELNEKYKKFDDSITEKDIKKNITFKEAGIYLTLNENLPEFLEQLKEKSDLLEKKFNIDEFIKDLSNEVGGDKFLKLINKKNALKKYNLDVKLTDEQNNRYNDYLVSFILAIKYYLTMKIKFLLGENIIFDPEAENGLLNDLYKTKELKKQYEDFKEIADKQKTKKGSMLRLSKKFISSLKKNIESKKKILKKLNSNNKPNFKYEYEITIDFEKVKSIFKDTLEQKNQYTPSKLQSTVKGIKSIPGIIEKSYEDLQSASAFFSGIKSDKQKEEEKRKKHRDAVLTEREEPPLPDRPTVSPRPPRTIKKSEPPRTIKKSEPSRTIKESEPSRTIKESEPPRPPRPPRTSRLPQSTSRNKISTESIEQKDLKDLLNSVISKLKSNERKQIKQGIDDLKDILELKGTRIN